MAEVQKSGTKMPFLHGIVDMGAQFLLAERVVVGEILVEQGVVGFGDILDELAVQGLDLVRGPPSAGDSVNLPLPSSA